MKTKKSRVRRRLRLIKIALIEKIEEWRDVRIALKACAEYKKNPESLLSHDEVLLKFGISKDELES